MEAEPSRSANAQITTTSNKEKDVVDNEASQMSQRSRLTALQHTQEISNQAMRKQIKFLSDKVEKAQ